MRAPMMRRSIEVVTAKRMLERPIQPLNLNSGRTSPAARAGRVRRGGMTRKLMWTQTASAQGRGAEPDGRDGFTDETLGDVEHSPDDERRRQPAEQGGDEADRRLYEDG